MSFDYNNCVPFQRRNLSRNRYKKPTVPMPVQEQPERKELKKYEEQEHKQVQESDSEHNLLSLCNELLFEIFKYLDSSSIIAMMNCSPRFKGLLLDPRFWHNIDLSNAPLPLGILEEILGRATEKTHTIKICGPPSSQHVAEKFKQFTRTLTSVLPKVATQLKVLELKGVCLDFEYITINEFPTSLKCLALKDCSVKAAKHVKAIFQTIEKQLVNLEDLSIEDNNWFDPYYIMAVSKLPSLRRLSLKGCQLMCKFVPYGSIAARFGFHKLEVLDLRLTPINNLDLQCFRSVESLKELLLESPLNPPSKTFNDDANGELDSHKIRGHDESVTSQMTPSNIDSLGMLNYNRTNLNSKYLYDMLILRPLMNRCYHVPMLESSEHLVSDRTFFNLGRITVPHRSEQLLNRLERIILRNYPHITNVTLEYLALCSPNLKYIDVSGTNITKLGLSTFNRVNRKCLVVATHLATDG